MKQKKMVNMMKRKISLDFTSLLDITMIILFFFLINFKFSVDDIKAEASAQMEAAAVQSERLEADKQSLEEEKEAWQKQAEAELDKIRETDKNAADNAEALLDFKNGYFISIDLEINKENVWKMTVRRGETEIGTIASSDNPNISDEFVTMLNREKFKKDDVIICVFKYNKKSFGSRYADNIIFKELKEAEYNFTNLYLAKSAYSADVL